MKKIIPISLACFILLGFTAGCKVQDQTNKSNQEESMNNAKTLVFVKSNGDKTESSDYTAHNRDGELYDLNSIQNGKVVIQHNRSYYTLSNDGDAYEIEKSSELGIAAINFSVSENKVLLVDLENVENSIEVDLEINEQKASGLLMKAKEQVSSKFDPNVLFWDSKNNAIALSNITKTEDFYDEQYFIARIDAQNQKIQTEKKYKKIKSSADDNGLWVHDKEANEIKLLNFDTLEEIKVYGIEAVSGEFCGMVGCDPYNISAVTRISENELLLLVNKTENLSLAFIINEKPEVEVEKLTTIDGLISEIYFENDRVLFRVNVSKENSVDNQTQLKAITYKDKLVSEVVE